MLVALVKATVSAKVIPPVEFIAWTNGTEVKLVPVIVTEVCAFVIVLGLILDIVGFVSAMPVRLLPSNAGKAAEPFNWTILFADVPTSKTAAVPKPNWLLVVDASFKSKAPKLKIYMISSADAPLASFNTVLLVLVKSTPSTSWIPFIKTKTGLLEI